MCAYPDAGQLKQQGLAARSITTPTKEEDVDLQQRVERLERENRRLKLIGLGLLILVGVAIAWQVGAVQPQAAFA
jgi:hypothetical protein